MSRPKACGQLRFAAFDPVWSHPLIDVDISNVTVIVHRYNQGSLYCSPDRARNDCNVECYRLLESMSLLISQRLLFLLCYSSYRLEKPRILGNLCAFFQQLDMFLKMVCASEVTDVAEELLGREMGKWILDAAVMKN